ncbi:hypothetical protein TrRE_jg11288, partial [Triparma retinervis]
MLGLLVTVVALFAIFATAALTVPDVPTSPQLTVLSDSSIEMSFSSPLSDGGSAVSSYTVEWDSDLGTQEIQTITS